MKILWTVNIIFPYPSKKMGYINTPYGGWLLGLYDKIKKYPDIELCIITAYKGNKIKKFREENTTYYLIPCLDPAKETKTLKKYCKIIYEDFKPDLIHIHGTEYAYGKIFQDSSFCCKKIVSIQGLKKICSNYYLSNLKIKDIKKNITFRNIIKGSSIKEQNNFSKSGKFEDEIINNVDAIVGRTTFDYSNTVEFTNNKKYYLCNESLRDEFYEKKWDIKNIEKHSIYISQGNYPLKGLHIMLEALNILKNKYPDIKLYIAGKNIYEFNNILDYIKFSDYQKLISKIIKKYNLKEHIVYTGMLNAEQVANRLLKSNIYVQASSIENSSNALGEAMLIGTPCVASFVGGTPDMLINNIEGLLYPFGDYGLLAHYISKIFDDNNLAIELSDNARKHAKITHNREINAEQMIKIYKKVIEGSDKK